MTHDSPKGEGDQDQISRAPPPPVRTDGNVYQARPKLFAIYFLRLIAEVSAAGVLGPDSCWLLTVIVSQEDTVWYRPVDFYNGQLMERAGIKSHDTLARVRAKLVEGGWLYYRAGTKSTPGIYWVLVPEQHRERLARLIPSADSSAHSSAGMRSEQVDTPHGCGGNEANHPQPCGGMCVPPNPNPNTPEESAPTASAPPRRKKTDTKTKSEPKPVTSAHREAVAIWCELWAAKYGTGYTFAGGKDGKHVSDILAAVGGDVDKFRSTVTSYLAATGAKILENRHPLAWLVGDVNKYKPAGQSAAGRSKTVNSREVDENLYGPPTQPTHGGTR